MIKDSATNQVYFSDKLKNPEYKLFLKDLSKELRKNDIRIKFLKGTNDIWCRDYMPVKVNSSKYILFNYSPDYLKGYEETISNGEVVCNTNKIRYIKSSLRIDGGNVVCSENKVILTNKIFKENSGLTKNTIINKLRNLFETDYIIIIPHSPFDLLGHADGIARFLNDDTVLVNKFNNSSDELAFQNKLFGILGSNGLNIIQIPYIPDYKKTVDGIETAIGCYINYLEVGKFIYLPFFGDDENDYKALNCFEKIFGKNVYPVDSSIIAAKGGGLNCISWSIESKSWPSKVVLPKEFDYHEMQNYVFDHVNFRLFYFEYDIIQSCFREVWERNPYKINTIDIAEKIYSEMFSYRRKQLIPKSDLLEVVNNLADYICTISIYDYLLIEEDIPREC